MNKLDQDIEMMQRVIEDRCPSCNQVGSLHDDHHDDFQTPPRCVRWYKSTSIVHCDKVKLLFLNNKLVVFGNAGSYSTVQCCEEDYELYIKVIEKCAREEPDGPRPYPIPYPWGFPWATQDE